MIKTSSIESIQKFYKKGKYRLEIDGLRGLAIIAATFHNFNRELAPCGYLGVDMFSVISGYVITSSIAGKDYKGVLDFTLNFYERRIKRLIPALVTLIVER